MIIMKIKWYFFGKRAPVLAELGLWVCNSENHFLGFLYHKTCFVNRIKGLKEKAYPNGQAPLMVSHITRIFFWRVPFNQCSPSQSFEETIWQMEQNKCTIYKIQWDKSATFIAIVKRFTLVIYSISYILNVELWFKSSVLVLIFYTNTYTYLFSQMGVFTIQSCNTIISNTPCSEAYSAPKCKHWIDVNLFS